MTSITKWADLTNPINTSSPPAWVQALMGGWDPVKYQWDPYTQTVIDRTTGGSYSMAGANPDMGSQLVTDLGAFNSSGGTAGAIDLGGATPYFGFGDSASGYNGGLMPNSGIFASTNPNEIADYRSHANDVVNRGVASVGALVGGAAALGGALGGGGAAGAGGATTAATTGTTTAAGMAPGTISSVGFGAGLGMPVGTGIPAAALTGGTGAVAGGLLPGVASGAGGLTGLTSNGVTPPAGGGGGGGGTGNWLDFLPQIISGVGALYGNNQTQDAIRDAQNAQLEALDRGLAFARETRDMQIANQEPFRQAAVGATGALMDMTGLPRPNGEPASYNWQTDPGYQFRINEGMRALENSAAARGGLMSGGFARKALRYATDYSAQEYANVYNRISNIAGLNQIAGPLQNQAMSQYGSNALNTAMLGGATNASGYVAGANSTASMLNQITEALGGIDWSQIIKS